MRRYRVLGFDFDARATLLNLEIKDSWAPDVKENDRENKRQVREGLLCEFGVIDGEHKIADFCDIGPAPFSVLAFHNRFMAQVRRAFTIGAYYPALTAACALGERVLNHLVLKLRDGYKASPRYKEVYRKESFDSWDVPIDALSEWGVLLPTVAADFRQLKNMRNDALHFDPATDHNDRELALRAITKLTTIINGQFGVIGPLPWFIPGTAGTTFLKQSSTQQPFVRVIYLPNCALVGPLHTLEHVGGQWRVHDEHAYPNRQVTDEEFARMANVHSIEV